MDVSAAADLYAAGVPMRVIANDLGVAESTVSRTLRRAGITTHPAGAKRAPVTDNEIIQLRMQGKLWRQIAAEVGMTTNGVDARYRRMQIVAEYELRAGRSRSTAVCQHNSPGRRVEASR